jgi:2-hydroxy-3-keto-5-methylthiopentenyl-1-phosphate phosphatase
MNSSRVVFCDFDGTITTKETFVSMVEKFAPEVSAQILPAVFRREITLRASAEKILSSIPAQDYPAIIEFMATQPVRPGLKEFIEFLNSETIPFVVISGGLIGMVKAVLEHQQLISGVKAIYAGKVDTSGDFLQPYCEISSDTEFVAKAIAMAQYSAPEKIAIGDSVTDINMSLAADLVFARDRLKQYLDLENKPYIQWHDFFEIRDYLAAMWQVN